MTLSHCIQPPELSDVDFLALLDGESKPGTKDHIETCGYCRSRYETLASMYQTFSMNFFRIECPDATVIGEYYLDLLPDDRRAEITDHLQICPYCVEELSDLGAFLTELESDTRLSSTEQIRVILARLIPERSPDSDKALRFSPAYAGTRGGTSELLRYCANGIQIGLSIYEDEEHKREKALYGVVTGCPGRSYRAQLFRNEDLIDETKADDSGSFSFRDLAEGKYHLVVICSNLELHTPVFEIDP